MEEEEAEEEGELEEDALKEENEDWRKKREYLKDEKMEGVVDVEEEEVVEKG